MSLYCWYQQAFQRKPVNSREWHQHQRSWFTRTLCNFASCFLSIANIITDMHLALCHWHASCYAFLKVVSVFHWVACKASLLALPVRNLSGFKKKKQLLWLESFTTVLTGDVLGLLLDVDNQKLVFYLNGDPLPPYRQLFNHARCVGWLLTYFPSV